MIPLDPISITVMRALRGAAGGWAAPARLARDLDLPPWRVRSILLELRKRYLVQRGNTVHGHWGEFSITEHGLLELANSEQLKLEEDR